MFQISNPLASTSILLTVFFPAGIMVFKSQILSLAFVAFFFQHAVAGPIESCPPDNSPIPIYLPDSDDCRLFYECSDGEPTMQNCPRGLFFDAESRTCT